jgi:hypothetical protein
MQEGKKKEKIGILRHNLTFKKNDLIENYRHKKVTQRLLMLISAEVALY